MERRLRVCPLTYFEGTLQQLVQYLSDSPVLAGDGVGLPELPQDLGITDHLAVYTGRHAEQLIARHARDVREKMIVLYFALGAFEIDQEIFVKIDIYIR